MVDINNIGLGTYTDKVIINGNSFDVCINIDQDYLSWQEIMGDYSGNILNERQDLMDAEITNGHDSYFFSMDMDELIKAFEGNVDKAKECYKSCYSMAVDYINDKSTAVCISITIDVYGKEFYATCGGYLMYLYNIERGVEHNLYILEAIQELTAEAVWDAKQYIAKHWQPELFGDL